MSSYLDIPEMIFRIKNTIPGFTDENELLALFNIAYLTAQMKGDIVEIGSWCGRSSVAIAMGAKLGGHNSPVYCVDLFPNLKQWKQRDDNNWMIEAGDRTAYKSEHPIYNDVFEARFRPVYDRSENLLDLFRYYISLFDIRNIIPHKGDINSFIETNGNLNVKFAFIDGDHDYLSVVSDIKAVSRRLTPSGILAIDDYGGVFSGVTKAVNNTIDLFYFETELKVTRKLFVAKNSRRRIRGG